MGRYQKSRDNRASDWVVGSRVLSNALCSLARATGRPDVAKALADSGMGGYSFERRGGNSTSGEFAVDYLWSEILSKFDDGKSSDAKRDAAMEKFHDAEMRCRESNSTLSRMVGLPSNLAINDIEQTMCLARRKVREILGRLDLNKVAQGFSFTAGASTRLKRATSTPAYKYSGTPETTLGNSDFAWAVVMSTPLWKRELCSAEGPVHLKIVPGNRVTTVPKNFKTDRVIAIEPDLNMYVQKGFGNYIRKRLKAWGCNLNDQTTNQDLAMLGSKSGLVATLDLSSASDTVSCEIVRFMLPGDWLYALEQCRSVSGELPSGQRIIYQKFASMGTGFTFELESLIFYALALAATEIVGASASFVSVYGDDIIVPTSAARLTVDTLTKAGFVINEKKSFIDGDFRESCGKHFLAGKEVTPFYVRRKLKSLTSLFLLHNKLYRWYNRCCEAGLDLDYEAISRVILDLRRAAPREWVRPRIPDGFGDGAFIGNFDEIRPSLRKPVGFRRGWEGFVCEVMTEKQQPIDLHERGFGYCKVSRGQARFYKSDLPPPTSTGRYLSSLEALESSVEGLASYVSPSVKTKRSERGFLFIALDGFAKWLTPLIFPSP